MSQNDLVLSHSALLRGSLAVVVVIVVVVVVVVVVVPVRRQSTVMEVVIDRVEWPLVRKGAG